MSAINDFKKISKEEWLSKANIDLKGKLSAESLLYTVDDRISFSPFLMGEDVENCQPVSGPDTRAAIKINSYTDREANTKALEMLNRGAEVIAFDVLPHFDFQVLFKGIFLDMVTVILFCNDKNLANAKLKEYLSKNKSEKDTNVIIFNTSECFRLSSKKETFSNRINRIRQELERHSENEKIYLFIELKKDFLTQIAELRAIRKLNETLRNQTGNLFIITEIKTSPEEENVHPLIIANYLLMSSYLGMADISFGLPWDDDGDTARLCLNIHHILKEESGFNFVTDPTAGAYIIEKLTQELIMASNI